MSVVAVTNGHEPVHTLEHNEMDIRKWLYEWFVKVSMFHHEKFSALKSSVAVKNSS